VTGSLCLPSALHHVFWRGVMGGRLRTVVVGIHASAYFNSGAVGDRPVPAGCVTVTVLSSMSHDVARHLHRYRLRATLM
jgi:hypothetical protein